MKFQREKITSGWDITKNVEGGADSAPPPALLGLIKQWGGELVGSLKTWYEENGKLGPDDTMEH